MKVNSLSNSYFYRNTKPINFNAHPDYNLLARNYNIKASSYFRRGDVYGSPSAEFLDVVKILNNIFGVEDFKRKRMLIAGIGDSQEPFSLLAVIKNIIKNKPLKDVLDLDIVDIQPKPCDKKLFEQSYFDNYIAALPSYAKDSFIKDDGIKYGLESYKRFRVKDDILDFLKQTYNDSRKSHWDSRVQDVVKVMDNEKYNVVSINNTFLYINDRNVIADTLNNIKRILKMEGVFITDPYYKYDNLRDSMTEKYPGIYRKL